jgi:hypothetical protein
LFLFGALSLEVLPHDAAAKSPKLVRFRHRFTLRLAPTHDDAAMAGTAVAAAGGMPEGGAATPPLPSGCFVVLSLHGSAFLRSHAEALAGLAVAIHRQWLPPAALEDSWRAHLVLPPGFGLDAVALPAGGCSLFVEGRYDAFEAKHHVSECVRGKLIRLDKDLRW